MRTTLVIKDEIFVSAKKLAAEKGCSFSAMVNDALRNLVNGTDNHPKDQRAFRIPVFKGDGMAIDSQPNEFNELGDEEDLNSLK